MHVAKVRRRYQYQYRYRMVPDAADITGSNTDTGRGVSPESLYTCFYVLLVPLYVSIVVLFSLYLRSVTINKDQQSLPSLPISSRIK